MKGYKALDKDMKAIWGNGIQFELGKKYTVKGIVIPCKNGFHFCEKIEYLSIFCDINDSRIFEIEASGDIKEEQHKYAAAGIQFVRELTREEIKDYFKQNQQELVKNEDWIVREAVAKQGCGLEELVHDKNRNVRIAVAEQGYGLDILVHDEDWYVRVSVANQGYGLDILVHDENCDVRGVVAGKGYGLNILVHDEKWMVRKEVAEQGYGLEKLIYDVNWSVRKEVAEQGYGLGVLVHDENLDVRRTAQKKWWTAIVLRILHSIKKGTSPK